MTSCVLVGLAENKPVVHAWAGEMKSSKSPNNTFPENKLISDDLKMSWKGIHRGKGSKLPQ